MFSHHVLSDIKIVLHNLLSLFSLLLQWRLTIAAPGDSTMDTNNGTLGSPMQLQCNAASSAEDIKKLLGEKLQRQLTDYSVIFNDTEVQWITRKIFSN